MDQDDARQALEAALRGLGSHDDRATLRVLQRAQDALDAVKSQRLAALEDSREYELDGCSSVTTWARNELRLDALQTRMLVAGAGTSRFLSGVGQAASSGRIRLEHVAAFSYGLKHIGTDIITEAEPWLLDVATTCEPAKLRRLMRDLREAVYPDELDRDWAKGMDKQDIQVNSVPAGWHVNGFLSTATGAKLKIVLDALGAPRDKDDDRPGAERRVTALDALLNRVLESGLPSDKGVRPHLSLIVDAETLTQAMNMQPGVTRSGSAAPAQLAGFGSIGPQLLGYLGCLSDVTPILTSGDAPQARTLNVGRSFRLATLKQRRAVIARQGGTCAAPGCRNTHLEIHHTIWWSLGGRTDLDLLIGLCVRCHHLIHRGLLVVTADGRGGFTFTDKDNRALRRDHRRRVADHRELARIRRTARDINTRKNHRLVPLRT